MAYYDAMVAKWATLNAGTTAQKLAQLNAITQTGPALPALLSPSKIINAIVPADLAALTSGQVTLMALCLSGAVVDASSGTTVRAAIQAIFVGKTTTLAQLGALVAPFDSPTISWAQANGYPFLGQAGVLTLVDCANAGLS